jgi:hypothetical protein
VTAGVLAANRRECCPDSPVAVVLQRIGDTAGVNPAGDLVRKARHGTRIWTGRFGSGFLAAPRSFDRMCRRGRQSRAWRRSALVHRGPARRDSVYRCPRASLLYSISLGGRPLDGFGTSSPLRGNKSGFRTSTSSWNGEPGGEEVSMDRFSQEAIDTVERHLTALLKAAKAE